MATVTVTAPDPGFTGSRAGVEFDDGRGEVDADNASALAYFARHGYAVETRSIPKTNERASGAAAKSAANTSTEGEPSDA